MKYNKIIVKAYFQEESVPKPALEYRFHPVRKWRFDMAWPAYHVALEVEGGTWTGGAHGRGSGIARDIEKYNAAACLGWWVLRVTPNDLCMLKTVKMLNYILKRSESDQFMSRQTQKTKNNKT